LSFHSTSSSFFPKQLEFKNPKYIIIGNTKNNNNFFFDNHKHYQKIQKVKENRDKEWMPNKHRICKRGGKNKVKKIPENNVGVD